MLNKRTCLAREIQTSIKHNLGGSITTFNHPDDTNLLINNAYATQADRDYKQNNKMDELQNKLWKGKLDKTTYDIVKKSTFSLEEFITRFPQFVNLKDFNETLLKEAILQKGLYSTLMGVQRGALLCNELAVLVLHKMISRRVQDSYSVLVFQENSVIYHAIAVIGLSIANHELTDLDVDFAQLIRENPEAIVIDLWNKKQSIFSINELPEYIDSLVNNGIITFKNRPITQVSIRLHLNNVKTFCENMQTIYPEVTQEYSEITRLLIKTVSVLTNSSDVNALQRNWLFKSPLIRPLECIGWCEPPPNSKADSNERTIVGV